LPLQYTLSPQSYLATRADVMQCIANGGRPWASGTDILASMSTLFALKDSIRTGQPVRPSLDPEAL